MQFKALLRSSASLAVAIGVFVGVNSAPADAANCFKKAAQGTAVTKKDAKVQVDEALLQATDWGAWASWMASGSTPGYSFGKRKYRCKTGGLGFECVGQAKICKL